MTGKLLNLAVHRNILSDPRDLSPSLNTTNYQVGKTFSFTQLNMMDILLVRDCLISGGHFSSTLYAFYADRPVIQAVTFPVGDGCQIYL